MQRADTAVQKGGVVDRRFLTFFTNWSVPKGMVFLVLVFWGLWRGLQAGIDQATESSFELIMGIAGFLCMWFWLSKDRRRFPEAASHYRGLALFMVWPFLLPVYALETRGWRRSVAGVLFAIVVAVGSGVVGVAVRSLVRGG